MRRSKVEVRVLYYRDKEEHVRKEENCNKMHPKHLLLKYINPQNHDKAMLMLSSIPTMTPVPQTLGCCQQGLCHSHTALILVIMLVLQPFPFHGGRMMTFQYHVSSPNLRAILQLLRLLVCIMQQNKRLRARRSRILVLRSQKNAPN